MRKIKVDRSVVLNTASVVISFFATIFVPYIINFEEELTYSNSIISLIVFASFIYLLKRTWIMDNKDKIQNVWSLGLIFSTFLVLGNNIKTNGMVEYGNF